MLRAQIKWQMDAKMKRLIEESPKKLASNVAMLEPLNACGGYMMRSFTRNAEAGGRPSWPALKPMTLLMRAPGIGKSFKLSTKRRAGLSRGLALADTGRLIMSFTSRQATGNVYDLNTPFKLELGSAYVNEKGVPLAVIHHYGATANIPEVRPKYAKALRWYRGAGSRTVLSWGRKGAGKGKVVGGRVEADAIFAMRAKAHTVRIPARPIAVIQPEDPGEMGKIFDAWIRKIVGVD